MDLQEIADVIMMKVVYGSKEGHVITAEDRDGFEYSHCLDAAQAILDGLHLTLTGAPATA
jgi:hypothetical protein